MRLSQQAIHDFKDIYHAEFHVELSDDEAEDRALRVLRLFAILSRPLTSPSQPPPPFDTVSEPPMLEEDH